MASAKSMAIRRSEAQARLLAAAAAVSELLGVPAPEWPTHREPEIARALQIQRGDVLLMIESQLNDVTGKIVDYSLSYFLPGYFRFHVVRRVGKETRD